MSDEGKAASVLGAFGASVVCAALLGHYVSDVVDAVLASVLIAFLASGFAVILASKDD